MITPLVDNGARSYAEEMELANRHAADLRLVLHVKWECSKPDAKYRVFPSELVISMGLPAKRRHLLLVIEALRESGYYRARPWIDGKRVWCYQMTPEREFRHLKVLD